MQYSSAYTTVVATIQRWYNTSTAKSHQTHLSNIRYSSSRNCCRNSSSSSNSSSNSRNRSHLRVSGSIIPDEKQMPQNQAEETHPSPITPPGYHLHAACVRKAQAHNRYVVVSSSSGQQQLFLFVINEKQKKLKKKGDNFTYSIGPTKQPEQLRYKTEYTHVYTCHGIPVSPLCLLRRRCYYRCTAVFLGMILLVLLRGCSSLSCQRVHLRGCKRKLFYAQH